MDLHALKNFLVIAEEENITKAAERLCISQPPLSRQLKNLENELGVKLFERSKQRIYLTKEGKYLTESGKRILELIDKTELQLKEMANGTTETLFLGSTETSSLSILPDCTESFRDKYPHYKYNIRSGNSNYVFDAMQNDLIDIGIVLEPYNTDYFEGFRLCDGYWMAVLHTSHPLSQFPGDSLEMTMLSGQDIILSERRSSQYDLIRFIEAMDPQPNIVCSFNLLLNGINLATSNMGIVILPSTSKDIIKRYPELTYKKLTAPEFPFHVAMIKRKNAVLSSLANLFYEFHRNRFSPRT